MQINLSKNDVRIIKEALDAWERESSQTGLMGGMIGALLSPKGESESQWKDDFRSEMEKARTEGQKRRDQATLIRAELIRAELNIAEHETTP